MMFVLSCAENLVHGGVKFSAGIFSELERAASGIGELASSLSLLQEGYYDLLSKCKG
jgi:hypothetical protein